MLGRIMKIFFSSNLQGRPSIFKEFFMLGRIIKIFFFSFKSAKLSSLQSQKTTKAAALVALVVMTPLIHYKQLKIWLHTLHSICSVVVSTMGFYPTLRGFEPHLRRFFIIFFLSKMRQKVKKSVSILLEGEEKIISFISDFSTYPL